MIEDWIKMRTSLYRDPKVCVIADALLSGHELVTLMSRDASRDMSRDMSVTRRIVRNAVVGALVSVWGIARTRGKRVCDDLHILHTNAHVVDDMADIPGFGRAMIAAGWLIEDQKGLVFPRFFEDQLNVDPLGYKRLQDAKRQRRRREQIRHDSSRDASRDSHVTVTHKCHITEEKRRDIDNTPQPPVTGGGVCDQTHTENTPAHLNHQQAFAAFWSEYPRKTNRARAARQFAAIEMTTELLEAIIAAIRRQKKTPQWRRDDGRYIPSPSKWLRERRWEDEVADSPAGETRDQRDARLKREREQRDAERERLERERAERPIPSMRERFHKKGSDA